MIDNQSQIALEVNDITKVFATSAGIFEALRGISFVINRGEFVSIVGPSGSGKSTLLNMIGALDRPTSGKVYIDGIDIFSLRDGEIASMSNRLIGLIFQSFNVINRSTVHKNIELPAIISDMSKQERNRRAFLLLETLGVADKAKLKTSSLSGGQQQRVAIARALINNPTMILADEPTGNLDTTTGNEVFALLKNLSSKFRRTIIMVTHNQELADQNDKIIGFNGPENIYGLDGKDCIQGFSDADVIYRGIGDDTILGGDGSDTIFGQDGNDFLFGDAGTKLVFGGGNALYGGKGDDLYGSA